jgi:uncharacterized protein GlcG (DUF336 family)
MSDLSLAAARTLLDAAVSFARTANFKPLAFVLLDARGALKAALAEDGTSLKRSEIAHGKAHGALAMGMGSRAIAGMVKERAAFLAAANHSVGPLIPVPGGVLIRSGGKIIGALGISGDTSDNDEAAAVAGIAAAGFEADTGG